MANVYREKTPGDDVIVLELSESEAHRIQALVGKLNVSVPENFDLYMRLHAVLGGPWYRLKSPLVHAVELETTDYYVSQWLKNKKAPVNE